MEIFSLWVDSDQGQQIARTLAATFIDALPAWNMTDLLAHQMSYAQRLADSEGPLLYEEMHKLFSLRDEIHAMRVLGLPADDGALAAVDAALRRRFAAESNKARLVAEDMVERWNRELWWYARNLQ